MFRFHTVKHNNNTLKNEAYLHFHVGCFLHRCFSFLHKVADLAIHIFSNKLL